jgi:hypothetical protein
MNIKLMREKLLGTVFKNIILMDSKAGKDMGCREERENRTNK